MKHIHFDVGRAEKRFNEKKLEGKTHCDAEFIAYEHGTHFVFPDGMLKTVFPIGSGLLLKLMFKAAKEYPAECKQTRIDIEKRVKQTIREWKK